MKIKHYIIAMLLLSTATFTGCGDLDTEGVSKTTYYALIELNGEQWNSVPAGGSFTDPGAVATEDGQQIELQVGGDEVDTNTPGVYTIIYTAINKDGFPSRNYRYVGVIDPAVASVDITGRYQRDAGANGISTVKKVAGKPNLYTSDNVGGVAEPGPATTVYFYHYAPGEIGCPYQLVAGSPFYCTDASIDEGHSYSWVVINGGYGTALRNFNKLP